MRVSFVGRVATNHTAFIRIKASQPAPSQELLILPVEVEVSSGEKHVTTVFSLLLFQLMLLLKSIIITNYY